MLNPTLTGILSASRTREGAQSPPLVSLSRSAEGAGEETYCRADENRSFEASLSREKNSLFWNCAPHVARMVSICMLYKYDVFITSALPFTASFGRLGISMSSLVRVVNFSYRYMYLKKAWHCKTYIDANSSIDFEKLHQIKN